MLHQPGRFYTILEVEKDAMESVFYELSGQRKDVFLDPSKEILIKSKDVDFNEYVQKGNYFHCYDDS